MSLTAFPGGLSSMGVPLVAPVFGKCLFVDGNLGADGNRGLDASRPLLTMAKAFTLLKSGDVIYFRGNIREQISTPAGIFDVTIVGCGNRPRHADAHTGNNGYSAATWKGPASPTASTPLLIIQQQGWKLMNFLMDGPSDAAAVQIYRDAGAGDSERDGSHAYIKGVKFVAGQNHIEFKGGPSQVMIEDCDLFGATADSLLETVGAGVGTNNHFVIRDNRFKDNATHIDVALNYADIYNNKFGKASGDKVDLRGGSENIITNNYFYGTYSNGGGYYAGTNDEWGGNYNVLAGGVTAADPA